MLSHSPYFSPKSLMPVPENLHAYPIKILMYKYFSSKNTYIYALPPTIYSSLTHNAIDISHD